MTNETRVFPGQPSAFDDHETKAKLERRDLESLSTEHAEQRRLGEEMIDPWAANRVPVERKPK